MSLMLSRVEQDRLELSKTTETARKAEFGQFLTPAATAAFMASLFDKTTQGSCQLLDPGAGIGSLSAAFLERVASGELAFDDLEITAFEIDQSLHPKLETTFSGYQQIPFSLQLENRDFIEEGVNLLQFNPARRYTHAILNPPYKKIGSDTRYRSLLRQAGLETVNLYAGFVGLSLALLREGGELVAIIPRSFCNGPYYRPFRNFILSRSAIKHIHLFGSRDRAFSDDGVLQENVIIKLEKDAHQKGVTVSTSTDDTFSDLKLDTFSFDRIVHPDDPEVFIHIPLSSERSNIEVSKKTNFTLEDLGISVSTGPVVDFRLKEFIQDIPGEGTVPLLYPSHFSNRRSQWPKPDAKKPNAIKRSNQTEKWLFPKGYYCIVKRFSSKEERRRIVASIVEPNDFPDAKHLGFENHLNVFHKNKKGLEKNIAWGLAIYLNAEVVDDYFRRFNGHTQVNATDLRMMKYPSLSTLEALGNWAKDNPNLTQEEIDRKVRGITG